MKRIISALLCIMLMLGCLSGVTLAATEIVFSIEPAVFLCGNIYNIVWTNNVASMGYVTYVIDGVEYTVYDEEGGIVRTDDYAHTVSIPVDELDAAGGYYVTAVAVESRTPYGVSLGGSCSVYRDFYGYHGQENINIWTVSDTHLTPGNFSSMDTYIKRAASHLKYGSPDLIMLLGDIANDVPNKTQALTVFQIAASLSLGNVPCVYTRGNHETRGEFSGYLLQYFPSDTGEFYFTFDYGPMTSIVLDFGEDKFDDHLEYGSLVNYNNYRQTQTEWLYGIESYNNPDAQYRIAFCHGPNVNNHFGYNWTRELDRLGTDLMVSGHTHQLRMHLEGDGYYEGFPIMIDGNHLSHAGFRISQIYLSNGNIECYGVYDSGDVGLEYNVTAGLNPPTATALKGASDAKAETETETTAVTEQKGAADFAIVTKPTVFDTGDTYTVAWATTEGKNSSGEVYVEYKGERLRFSDDESGTLRCLSNVHAVRIPKEYLEGSRYEVISKHVILHSPYGSATRFGKTASTGYLQFEGYSGQDEIKMAVLSDTASDKSAFYKLQATGVDFDVLLLTGNTVRHAQTSSDIINGLLINTGYLTGGRIPVVFSRGSAETRGEYAPYLSWIVRNSTRQFYERVEYGPVTLAVLDSSGLVPDTDPDTFGLSCFASVRQKQQTWLNSFSYGDAEYKLALTSAPRLYSLVGHNFARSLNDLGTDLVIASGDGTSAVQARGYNSQNYTTVLNGSLYGDGTVATLLTFKDGNITSTVITENGSGQNASVGVGDNDATVFSDVEDAWYTDAVGYVSRQQLMVGVGKDEFAPEQILTRAMAVQVLANLENAADTEYTAPFTDVDADAYYASAVAWAYQNGVVYGVDADSFDPDSPVTREQLCAMLCRLYGGVISGYEDKADGAPADMASVSPYAREAVMLLYKKGIVCGMGGGVFSPRDGITRAQLAQILYKADLNVQITYSGIGQ